MKIRKILFVHPKIKNLQKTYLNYPLGIALLASMINQKTDILIYDENIESNKFINIIESYTPDAVCFSMTTSSYCSGLELLKDIKKFDKKILTIAGGSHATALPYEVISDGFDYVITGRCDGNLIDLLRYIEISEEKINAQKILNGKPCHVDNHPKIKREYFKLGCYNNHSIFTSLGCPYNCAFCSNHSNNVQMRSIENVIKEIYTIVDDEKDIFFIDDVFAHKKSRIIEFCNSVKKNNIKMKFMVQLRCDSVDELILSHLADIGCKRILIGAESGSNKSLSIVDKKQKEKTIRQAIFIIEKYGIIARTNWIIGLPGSYQDQKEFLKIIDYCRPSEISIHPLIPFPGTKIWDNPHEYGIKILNRKNYEVFNMNIISNNFKYECTGKNGIKPLLLDIYDNLLTLGYQPINKGMNQQYVFNMPIINEHYSI